MKFTHKFILVIVVIAGLYWLSSLIFAGITIPDQELYRGLDYLKFNQPAWVTYQKVAFTIFFTTIVGTVFFWKQRLAIASMGIGFLLLSGAMDVKTTIDFMSIPTILFIISMLTVVGWLDQNQVFEYWITKAIRWTKGNPNYLFVVLMVFSVVLAGLADEVTAIVVSVTLALRLCKQTKVPPLPYVLALVFATNVGSALTLVGNPIGIYIAFASGLGFQDFLRWATPISFMAFVVTVIVTNRLFRKQIATDTYATCQSLDETRLIVHPRKFLLANLVFIGIISLLFVHKRLELLLGLSANTALMAIPMIGLGVAVLLEEKSGRRFTDRSGRLIEEKVQWRTVLFFMFLFAKAACLEYTGVTPKIAYVTFKFIESFGYSSGSSGMTAVALTIVLLGTGLLSGFVDNLPIVAALVPVVKNLHSLGLPHANILWWALLFGGCFGGNLTMIGSTANLVAVGVYEKETGHSIGFLTWMKSGVIVTFITLILALLLLLVQIGISR